MVQDSGRNAKRGNWRQRLLIIGTTLTYMVPLFWLWGASNFPDGFGVVIREHGKVGLLEEWWYSYLLLNRPNALNLATFAYMWLPIFGLIGWLIHKQFTGKSMRFSIFAESPKQPDDQPRM